MIIGLGSIGGWGLEFFLRESSIAKVVVADIRETYGMQKLNTALAGAYHMGYYPEAEFIKIDLLADSQRNAELIRKINPRLIVNSTTMLTEHTMEAQLPPDLMKPLTDTAGWLGPCLALNLRIIYHLMLAVKASGLNPYVINTSVADLTGPCLKTQGLHFTVGIGSLDNMAVLVKKQVADQEGVKPRDVIVYLVANNFNNRWFIKESPGPCPPYFIKIFVDHRDVTDKYDTYELLKNSALGRMRLAGFPSDSQTGSSMCKHGLALLNDSRILTNALSPNGLPGGYPSRIGAYGVKLALPEGITEDEAIEINLEGQRREGIKEVTEDGTVIFEDAVVDAWRKIMNFNCKSFHIKDVDEVAEEQISKLKELMKKYGGT
jgi:hypothetical protein